MPSLLMSVLVVLLLTAPSGATTQIVSGGLGDREEPFGDQAFLFTDANGHTLGGSKIEDLQIGMKLTTGHYSTTFGGEELFGFGHGSFFDVPGSSMVFNFTFAPITLLTLSPLDPGVAGAFAGGPFTMTGQFIWPGVTTIDYVGQGTVLAGWFPRDSNDFGFSFVGFTFNAPEPPGTLLLVLGLVAVLRTRLGGKRR
jgi:hypothetical protein